VRARVLGGRGHGRWGCGAYIGGPASDPSSGLDCMWLGWVGLCKRAALKCWAGTRVARVLRLALGLICDCFDGWVGFIQHQRPALLNIDPIFMPVGERPFATKYHD
jgi:hypothetical protein